MDPTNANALGNFLGLIKKADEKKKIYEKEKNQQLCLSLI